MKKKTMRMGLYSILLAVLAIAIAVGVNLFVASLPSDKTKIDTTNEEVYSISEQSEKIVKNLPDKVTIYLLASETGKDTSLYEFLQRYEDAGDKVTVEIKDPVLYPNFSSEYTDEDVAENSVVVVGKNGGKYIPYSDIYVQESSLDYSTYQYVTNTSFDGENCITSAIDYVTSDDLPVVYRLTGHGEENMSDYSTTIENSISSENITLKDLNLLTEDSVPEDASAVLLFAPTTDLSEEELEMLRSYEQRGGKFLLLTDFLEDTQTGIKSLLADFGMETVEGVVLESDRGYYYQYQSYLLPNILTHEIVNPLKQNYQLLMPNSQGGKEIEDTENVSVTPLLQTGENAYSKIDGVNITTYTKEEGDIDGPFYLAAVSTLTGEDYEAQMVYIPSTAFLADQINTRVSNANHDLFLNALEWLCDREEQVSIRAKSLDVEYLSVDEKAALNWEIIFMGIIPVGLLIFGGIVIYRRRR